VTGRPGSLLARLAAQGAALSLPAVPRAPAADAERVAAHLREAAAALPDETRALASFEAAGRLHDPLALDAVLARVAPRFPLPFAGGVRKWRLRDAARSALRTTSEVGALELACALLGQVGTEEDAAQLEVVGRHPELTLYGATALSNLTHWQGRAALLRLLTATEGNARVLVIDRLLPHTREPAVRLALVRDALHGLDAVHAAEVAGEIAERCGVRKWIDDPAVPDDVRRGAELVLRHAGGR
jgi:hypothetical protein